MGVKSADDLSWHSTSWLPDEPFVRDHKERGSKRPFCSAPEKNIYLGWRVSPSKLMSSQNLWICPYLAIGSLDVFKLRQGHAQLGLALNPLGLVSLCEEANLDPELQGDTMWLWREELQWCQGLPRIAKDCQQQSQTGRSKEGPLSSLSLQRVHGPADTLISDSWSPKLQEKKCLWF